MGTTQTVTSALSSKWPFLLFLFFKITLTDHEKPRSICYIVGLLQSLHGFIIVGYGYANFTFFFVPYLLQFLFFLLSILLIRKPALPDTEEPVKVAKAIRDGGLKYVVITSVCRDDLANGGASHISDTIKAIKLLCPKIIVEPLIPDFRGNFDSLEKIVNANPEVISHNIETVFRLTNKTRDARASYSQSLRVLKKIKEFNSKIYTKSSLIVGLGENEEEVTQAALDLRAAGVDVLTIGQYLQPTSKHLPVVEYISPDRFKCFRENTERMGFKYVAAGPLVRSSYRAGEFFLEKVIRNHPVRDQ